MRKYLISKYQNPYAYHVLTKKECSFGWNYLALTTRKRWSRRRRWRNVSFSCQVWNSIQIHVSVRMYVHLFPQQQRAKWTRLFLDWPAFYARRRTSELINILCSSFFHAAKISWQFPIRQKRNRITVNRIKSIQINIECTPLYSTDTLTIWKFDGQIKIEIE